MENKIEILHKEIVVRYMDEVTKEELWELKQPLSMKDSNGEYIFIPKGFETDFASVPKSLWSFVGPIGKFNFASVVHDYFYTTHCVKRKFADDEFLRIMDYTNPSSYIRNRVMWLFVRLFGRYRWNHYGNGI